MNRKVQVFSMPGKVSIGQDRNKKVPHRGRKPCIKFSMVLMSFIEIKKFPIGDGNFQNSIVVTILQHLTIEIKKFPIGDGNDKRRKCYYNKYL